MPFTQITASTAPTQRRALEKKNTFRDFEHENRVVHNLFNATKLERERQRNEVEKNIIIIILPNVNHSPSHF